MPNKHLTNTRFRSLDLSPALVKGLDDLGFDYCTPIQAKTLPLALSGKDVAGQAQTGTGKTAAFLLATMHHLMRHTEAPPPEAEHTDPRAIILAPTRELAIQIDRDAESLGKHTGLRTGLAYGGTGYESQRRRLEEGWQAIPESVEKMTAARRNRTRDSPVIFDNVTAETSSRHRY